MKMRLGVKVEDEVDGNGYEVERVEDVVARQGE
jgi:hypothetical protein